jgi:hypothetical protein
MPPKFERCAPSFNVNSLIHAHIKDSRDAGIRRPTRPFPPASGGRYGGTELAEPRTRQQAAVEALREAP